MNLFFTKVFVIPEIRRLCPVLSLQDLLVELQTKTLVGSSHIEKIRLNTVISIAG